MSQGEAEDHQRLARSTWQRLGRVSVSVLCWAVVLGLSGWALSQFATSSERNVQQAFPTSQTAAFVPVVDTGGDGSTIGGYPQQGIQQDQLHERAVRYCENAGYRGQSCVAAVESGNTDVGYTPRQSHRGLRNPNRPEPYAATVLPTP